MGSGVESLSLHIRERKRFPPLPVEEGDAAGWTRGRWSREHLPSSAACADAPGRAWPLQSQLYKRINPAKNSSLPGALPALVSCSRNISVRGRAEGLGMIFPWKRVVLTLLSAGSVVPLLSRGGGSCLQSDSLCLQRLRNSSGNESHSFFFLAWIFRAFFKLSQLGRSVAAVSRFRIILSVIAF